MNGGLDPDPARNCKICGKEVFLNKSDAMGGKYIANNGICNSCLAPHKVFEKMYEVFSNVGRFRRKILKFIFPELIQLADELREYYWSK